SGIDRQAAAESRRRFASVRRRLRKQYCRRSQKQAACLETPATILHGENPPARYECRCSRIPAGGATSEADQTRDTRRLPAQEGGLSEALNTRQGNPPE